MKDKAYLSFKCFWVTRFLSMVLFSSVTFLSFVSRAYPQLATPTPDFQKLANDIIAEQFRPYSIESDMEEYGNSPVLNAEVAFLGLNPTQKENYVSYIHNLMPLCVESDHIFPYKDRHAKTKQEKKKLRDRYNYLQLQFKKIPGDLRRIFGDEIYERYCNYMVWEYLYVPDWGNEAGENKKRCEEFDYLNDRDLADTGISNQSNRRLALDTLYKDYAAFEECRNKIVNGNDPQYSHKAKKFSDDTRMTYVSEFAQKRKERRMIFEKIEKEEKTNDGFRKKLGSILNP